MRTLELLLNRRWILKSRERELYYQVKEELSSGEEKKFLMEKLGYQVVVNPYMIKVEKMPAVPENWMGILEFKEPIEYVFFCLVLMFLEDKEAEEQFVRIDRIRTEPVSGGADRLDSLPVQTSYDQGYEILRSRRNSECG